MKKKILILGGPTATGKTNTGIYLAKALNGEIISADSMQIYKYMDIGTAKPTIEEMEGVPHHMIDVVYPHESFSAALFREMAGRLIYDITDRGKLPIVVGGTGLYINSLIYNLDFTKTAEDLTYREELNKLREEKGNLFLHEMLKEVDFESYQRLHPNNFRRVIRALEVYKNTGKTISEYQRESKCKDSEFDFLYFGLIMDRAKLYDRINKRVDLMIERGLVDEVKALIDRGYNKNLTSMQGIGYKEVFDYIEGMKTLDEVAYNIKQNSRRYAKRQITWFNHQGDITWVNIDDYKDLLDMSKNIYNTVEGKFKLL